MMQTIPWLLIGFLLILNFGISWWNARVVGLVWVETKQVGGWQRFMTWMAAIMSASGFTWCYLFVLLFGGYYAQGAVLEPGQMPYLTERMIRDGFSLGYLIIIPGVLFSGLMIWIDSLIEAWRRRDAPSIGIAAYNTFAQAHNMYSAFEGVGSAWDSARDLFSGGKAESGGDSDSDNISTIGVLLVLALVAAAIGGGILTTTVIVRSYAATRPLPRRAVA